MRMTEKKNGLPRLSAQDKAERTTQTANTIMDEERRASNDKVARLKALRLKDQPSVPEAVEGPKTAPATKRPTAVSVRSLALHGETSPRKRKAP